MEDHSELPPKNLGGAACTTPCCHVVWMILLMACPAEGSPSIWFRCTSRIEAISATGILALDITNYRKSMSTLGFTRPAPSVVVFDAPHEDDLMDTDISYQLLMDRRDHLSPFLLFEKAAPGLAMRWHSSSSSRMLP